MLVTFEGIDGSGKTTVVKETAETLIACGVTLLVTSEPDEATRGFIAKLGSPLAQLFAYLADRAEHVAAVIKPELDKGDAAIVLCDRYSDSTIAYQAYGYGLNANLVDHLCREAEQGVRPDLTFLLDLPPEEAATRIQARDGENAGESQLELLTKVRDGYLKLAKKDARRFVVIDASQPLEKVTAEVWAKLWPAYTLRRAGRTG